MDQEGRLLDLKNRESLVYSLSAFTCDMIADKNPDDESEVLLQ